MLKVYKYKINKDTKKEVDSLFFVLSQKEQKRARSYKFEKDFLRYSAGKIITKNIIADIYNKPPEEVEFYTDKYDRPFVKYPEIKNFDFNISHSGKYVVLAVSDKKVGIDVEKIKSVDLDLSREVFHRKEIEYLYKDKSNSLEKFFEVWTLKESFVKMVGEGLSYPLKNFYFEFLPDNNVQLNLTNENKQDVFIGKYDGNGYKFAVCSEVPVLEDFYNINNLVEL